MKNEHNEILEAKIAERSERAKKLYRYITDVARRIDEATAVSQSIVDLFSTNIEIQRQKLRDNCEKLLFLDPTNYGKKSLELLWRKVYYETVSIAKKLKESGNEYDNYLFTHIVCGIGHFHHLASRLQSDMKLEFKELDYNPLNKDEEIGEVVETLTEDGLQFGKSALHSCLIYLGDLSRYESEIFHTFDPSIAARYYLQAAHIDMSSGMPYNQLGNLYLDKNYNLDSVCYYMHCLGCMSPFEGAIGNLIKIFEKNAQYLENFNTIETLSQLEHIQNIVTNFLALIEIWYFGKSDTNIPQKCNSIAQELKIAMDFDKMPLPDMNKNYNDYIQAIDEENINPSYLNGNLVHKMVQICLLTMSKMSETDEKKAFACKAFTLALLSQLLQKLLMQLESFGFKNPAHKYRSRTISIQSETEKVDGQDIKETNQKDNESIAIVTPVVVNGIKGNHACNSNEENVSDDSKKIPNGEAKNNKKTLAKRRRRRRVASSGSSDISNDDTESSEVDTDESCSDEELSDSSYESDGDGSKSEDSHHDASDLEEKNVKVNGVTENTNATKNNQQLINGTKGEQQFDDVITSCNNTEHVKPQSLNVNDIQNFLLGANFLPSIKLLQDWLLTEKDLILSCGDSGESLFQCIVDLLNIFTFYFNPKKSNDLSDNCRVLQYCRNIAKNLKLDYKTVPLPEDVNLRGTNICKFDKAAAEWQILDKYKPSVYEENVIRILNFIEFGNQIAKIVPYIRFNRSMGVFYLKKLLHPKLNTKINHKRTREWHNSKKQNVEVGEGGLLRRLGRLWLASQVRELERSGQSPTPAFLAVDAAALNQHLRRVKQLMRSRNFILLIPTVVLQELDDLKREKSTARDAIRWLEMQLKSGSRFLRAQRPGQTKPLPLLKYPRKAPSFVQNFIQILEFCYHFIGDEKQQAVSEDPDKSLLSGNKSVPLLILLIGNESGSEDESFKEFSLTGAAQSAGIPVEYIGDFYTKWRHTLHKNDKKR